jgi:hypothetical protein
VCFVVCKTISQLERVILTTLYLAGAKNTNKYAALMSNDSWDLVLRHQYCHR